MDKEAYAIPFVLQTSRAPKGLPLSLQTAGIMMRGILPRFPVHIKSRTVRKLNFYVWYIGLNIGLI